MFDTVRDEGWDQWSAFTRTVPYAGFFASRAWLRAIHDGMGQDIAVHVALCGGRVLAGAVVRRGARLGVTVARKPWATAYTGPFFTPGNEGAAETLIACMRGNYGHLRLVTPPRASVPRVPREWTREAKQTPVLRLGDEQVLWDSFDRHVRQRVRKAQRLGVVVRETRDAHSFYALYQHTYAHHGLPMPLGREEVTSVLDAAADAGVVRVFTAHTVDGDAAAGLVVGMDDQRVYFVLAGSHPVHRKTDAMSLLWWEVLRLYGRTHSEADLVGCGLTHIDRFKDAFSPEKADYADLSGWAPGLGGLACRGVLAVRRWLQPA